MTQQDELENPAENESLDNPSNKNGAEVNETLPVPAIVVPGKSWKTLEGISKIPLRESPIEFLRYLPDGYFQKHRDQKAILNQQKLADAAASNQPAPWTIAGQQIDNDLIRKVEMLIGEDTGEPRQIGSVTIPPSLQEPRIVMGNEGTRLLIHDNQELWVVQLPLMDRTTSRSLPTTSWDDPGDLDNPRKIELGIELDRSNRLIVQPTSQPGIAVVASGTLLLKVDLDQGEVIQKKSIPFPVASLSYANQSHQILITGSQGELNFLSDNWQELTGIGQADPELPAPSISSDGRIVAYFDKPTAGKVLWINNGSVVRNLGVIFDTEEVPRHVYAGNQNTSWLLGNAFWHSSYPLNPPESLEVYKTSVHHKIQAIDSYPMTRPAVATAERTVLFLSDSDDETDQIHSICDLTPFNRNFTVLQTCEIPSHDGISVGCTGQVFAYITEGTVNVFDRFSDFSDRNSFRSWSNLIVPLYRLERFDEIQKIANLTRALPEIRNQREPEWLYYNLITSLFSSIISENTASGQQKQINSMIQWAKQRPSDLNIVALMRFYSETASSSRGASTVDKVSEENWKDFQERLKIVKAFALDVNQSGEEIPMEAYRIMFQLWLYDRSSFDNIDQFVFNYLSHHSDIYWGLVDLVVGYLPQWGGDIRDFKNLTASLADVIGGQKGDIAYACWLKLTFFRHGADFFLDTGCDRARVLRGIKAGADTDFWSPGFTEEALDYAQACVDPRMNSSSIRPSIKGLADQTIQALLEHHKRNVPVWTSGMHRRIYVKEDLEYLPW